MTREQIKLGIKKCIEGNCATCPYREGKSCSKELKTDALNLILNLELELGKDLDFADAEPWTRQRVLKEAERCACGKREQDYGWPEDNFGRIANLWSAYMGVEFTPVDVSMMMVMLKAARIKSGGGTMDSFVDGCGYFSCGGEIFARNLERSESL